MSRKVAQVPPVPFEDVVTVVSVALALPRETIAVSRRENTKYQSFIGTLADGQKWRAIYRHGRNMNERRWTVHIFAKGSIGRSVVLNAV